MEYIACLFALFMTYSLYPFPTKKLIGVFVLLLFCINKPKIMSGIYLVINKYVN